ncbi:MAG: FixH family protein [Rhodocyclaceae bacterium]|nr:FixH family protein [Rhodocyclaceae bacterium]
MTIAANENAKPWYREPWPWFLMSGPFIVVIAALVSAWIAIKSDDGLVTEDYYQQGLVAGETVARSKRAEELGITAGLRLTNEQASIRLSARTTDLPAALVVMLSHPTRAGIDQKSLLKKTGDAYVGKLNLPTSGHWLVLVEDEARTWRVMGSVLLPAAGEVVIGGSDVGVSR